MTRMRQMYYICRMREKHSTTISLRLPLKMKIDFYAKARTEPNQDAADVLRNLIAAYLRKSTTKEKSHVN